MRPKKFACLICGKRFNLKSRVLLHVFNNHLRQSKEFEVQRFCWCQPNFSLLGSWSLGGWKQHLLLHGGLQSHYATHALNIGG